ncbi:esterase-like activity of phytase family protein [Tenacibaculum sp. 1_MG-2023]|uniref:esterase-like activity of phytase family protein n=1 Tax=Tenacibaculum sp. 1_MG-2023 TaxID=3062653 RepID=UPI0026E315F6|nr:esterase-like activity of phytase family protein [Tenacibaculum sp. 1_MG-2023]MDO6675919.1 esterase-like activity of phytase family protein [Tenacibaculum sp. 1_MG-2023]
MKKIVLALSVFGLLACKQQKISLKFLDEYVINDSLVINNTVIGGVSGIDFYNNNYYMVVDDATNPRILIGNISIENDSIQSVDFEKVIVVDTTSQFTKNHVLDLESIFVDKGTINLTSEGSIQYKKDPSIFEIHTDGSFKREIKIPNYFKATSKAKPKHNGIFEGSSKSFDGKGFWVAMEAPLEADGEEPTFHETQSPIRITYFDNESKKATKQFAYQLEKIDKPAKGNINLNGTTAILEYEKNHFFIIERAYQSGYESYGNVVRIFKASINDNSTNTLEIQSLKNEKYTPLKKELLLDFSTVQSQLTDGIIDNIEAITFGPILQNGNKSLILAADDNFQLYGKQLNQFLLLEIEEK